MKRSCQHCGELIVGNAYRVTSEEDNVTLLDMVVCSLCSCSLCSMEAKRLGLRVDEISMSSSISDVTQ